MLHGDCLRGGCRYNGLRIESCCVNKMKRALVRGIATVTLFVLGVASVRLGTNPTVVVTWETASEVDTAGFLLYRGNSPEGPFQLLIETPVPAQGDPLVGSAYQYEDREVAWGQSYFYQLEEVERGGTRNRSDDIVEAQAGVGWPWAIAGGAGLATLGVVAFWLVGYVGRQPGSTVTDRSALDSPAG